MEVRRLDALDPAAASPPLREGGVHLWSIELDGPEDELPALLGLLSPDERRRARAYCYDRHRRRFVAARARLRQLLAAYAGGSAAEIRFRYGPHGKPELAGESVDGGVRFNLAHSEDLALCALARERRVGVDLELRREPRPRLEAIARAAFHPHEARHVRAVEPGSRYDAFLRIWTLKEACLKGEGLGLAARTDGFDVAGVLDGAPLVTGVGRTSTQWRCFELRPALRAVAAVAVEELAGCG